MVDVRLRSEIAVEHAAELTADADVDIEPRRFVLAAVVWDLTKAFSPSSGEAVKQTIERGIIRKKLLSAINIHFLDSNGRECALVKLLIDWEAHQLNLKAGKRFFQFDRKRSIAEQISAALPKIVDYMNGVREHFGVVDTKVSYNIDPKTDRKKASKFLELQDMEALPRSDKTLDENHVYFRYIAKVLSELCIEVRHRV